MLDTGGSVGRDVGVHAVGFVAVGVPVYPSLHSTKHDGATVPAEYWLLLTLSAGQPTGLHVVAPLT